MKKFCLLISALSVLATGTQAQILSGADGDYALMPVSDTNKISLADKAAGYSFKIYDNGGAADNYSNGCESYMLLTAPEGSRIVLSGNINTEWGFDRLKIYNGANSSANLSGSYEGTTDLNLRSTGSQLFLSFHSDNSSTYSGFEITATIFTPIVDGDFVYADAAKTELMGYNGNAESVTIPKSVNKIDEESFLNCTTLKTVVIGDSVKFIGSCAFQGCSGLEKINIPASVLYVGSYAFNGCDSLKSVTAETFAELGNAGLFITKDSIKYGIYEKTHAKVAANSYSGDVVIPASFTAGNTFEVSVVGDNAFDYCTDLTSVTIPEGIETIGSYAFKYCKNLKSIEIPKTVKNIGSYAFYGAGLKSMTIPSSITDVSYNAFSSCDSLTSVTIETNADISSAGLSFTKDGLHFNVLNKKEVALAQGDYSSNVVIPSSVTAGSTFAVTSIGHSAFYGCQGLKSVTIPVGIKSIGDYAFYNCDSLISVVIPEGVTEIGDEAFYGCDTLSSVVIPEGVTILRYNTFYNCRNLSSITIPNSVVEFGTWLFASCTNLKSIYMGAGIDEIGSYTFDKCTSLETITICRATPPNAYYAFTTFDSAAYSKITLRVPKGSKATYQKSDYWKEMNIVEFDVYNVTLIAEGGEATFSGDGAYEAKAGAKATVSAKPRSGYEFVKWSDGNTDNPRTINLTSDITLKAVMAEKYCTVTLLVDDVRHGYIRGDKKVREGYYEYYNAYGAGEYIFDHWDDGSTNSQISFTVTQDTTLKAFFKKSGLCQVTLSSDDYVMGYVSTNTTCLSGEQVNISAWANDGYKFVSWSDGNTNGSWRYVRVTSDTNLVAHFRPLEECTVNFVVPDSCKQMGKVVYTGSDVVKQNSYAYAEAVAESGYIFKGWYFDDGTLYSGKANIDYYVEDDVTLYARFVAKPNYAFVPYSGVEYATLKVGDTITIYDSEGPDANYIKGNSGFLQLNGLKGYAIKISGSYNTERYRDNISFYLSTADKTDNRLDSWYGVGTSTVFAYDTVVTIYFYSSTISTPSSGFKLKATLVKMLDLKDVPYNVAIASNDTALGNLNINYIIKEGSSYQFGLEAETKRPGEFNSWSDNYYSYYQSRIFEVYSDTTLTARFDALKAYNVTIESSDTTMGKIKGDQSGIYYDGEYISFNAATNNSDFIFVKWNDNNTNKNRGFYVTKDTTFVAEFKTAKKCTVTIMVNDTTYGYGYTQTYNEGEKAWISAYTKNDAFFVDWSDGFTESSRNITVTSDTTFTANLAPMPYKYDIHSNDTAMGSVYYRVNEKYNEYIYSANLEAYPKPGYVFKCWSDGYVNLIRSKFYIVSDTTLVAIFEPIKHKINVVCENGEVTYDANLLSNNTYAIECYVSADQGYCFAGWHDGYQLLNRTFEVSSDTTLTAKFVKFPYKVNLVYDDKKGTASYSTQGASLEKPTVDFSVTEKPGYGFSHWIDGENKIYSKSISWTLSSDITIEAVFEELAVKALVYSNDTAMGTVSQYVYSWDSTFTEMNFRIEQVKKGYHFVMWSDSVLSMYRYETFRTDTTITAIFAPNFYKIVATAKDASMGSVTAPDSAAFNSTITLTAKAASGYNFVKWSDGNTSNPRNVTVDGEMKFEAIFEKATAVEESVASSVNIYAYQNVIVVENADTQIRVYDAMGKRVTTSNDTNAKIRIQGAGIYIVKVGNAVERIAINN